LSRCWYGAQSCKSHCAGRFSIAKMKKDCGIEEDRSVRCRAVHKKMWDVLPKVYSVKETRKGSSGTLPDQLKKTGTIGVAVSWEKQKTKKKKKKKKRKGGRGFVLWANRTRSGTSGRKTSNG